MISSSLLLQAASYLISISATSSWLIEDEVTLHFWSHASDCNSNHPSSEVCNDIAVEAGFVIDNTGVTCYKNPTSTDNVYIFIGPPEASYSYDNTTMIYQIHVPAGEPVPECDSYGQCSCEVFDVIRGTDSSKWSTNTWTTNTTNTMNTSYGYGIYSSKLFRTGFSGCGVSIISTPLEGRFENISGCYPFQGNITVKDEYGYATNDSSGRSLLAFWAISGLVALAL